MNKTVLISALLFSSLSVSSLAAPEGGEVRAGSVTIQGTTIRQLTDKAIVDWQRFNVSPDELVRFVQPNETAVLLNRVVGGDPSRILGKLQANGQLFLVNPNGVLFGPSSQVDVGSLVATTLNISNDDFLSGNYHFVQDPSFDLASVVNQGTIHVSDEGYVILSAPLVSNEGLIVANLGKVVLGSGDSFAMNLDGRGLVSYQLAVSAGSGTVTLTPDAVSDVLRGVVQKGDLVSASALTEEDGVVRLAGSLLVNSGTVQGSDVRLLGASKVAVGGVLQGDFVETSSQHDILLRDADVRVSAGGTWLVDPGTITIVSGSPGVNEIQNTQIQTSLDAGANFDVIATTLGSDGNIVQNADAPIAKTAGGDATLSFQAGATSGTVTLNAPITSTVGALNVTITGGGAVTTGVIDANGGAFSATVGSSLTAALEQTPAISVSAGGSVTLTHAATADTTLSLSTTGGTVQLDQTGGFKLSANAVSNTGGSVLLSNDADLAVDLVTGTDTIELTASGAALLELNSDPAADASAPTVVLTAGTIGNVTPFQLSASNVSAAATGAINLQATGGGTTNLDVQTVDGEIRIDGAAGTLRLANVVVGGNHDLTVTTQTAQVVVLINDVQVPGNLANLSVSGDIFDGGGSLVASTVTLAGRVIGGASQPVRLEADTVSVSATEQAYLLNTPTATSHVTMSSNSADMLSVAQTGGQKLVLDSATGNGMNFFVSNDGGDIDVVSTNVTSGQVRATTTTSGTIALGNVVAEVAFFFSAGTIEELGAPDPSADVSVLSSAVFNAALGVGASSRPELGFLASSAGASGTASNGNFNLNLIGDGRANFSATNGDVSLNTDDGLVLLGSAGHDFLLTGLGNIEVSQVVAGNAIQLGGSVVTELDSALDAASDLTARSIQLAFGSGIGAPNPLEIRASELDASVSGSGNIRLANLSSGLLQLNALTVGSGSVTLTTPGYLTYTTIQGSNVSLTAGTGIEGTVDATPIVAPTLTLLAGTGIGSDLHSEALQSTNLTAGTTSGTAYVNNVAASPVTANFVRAGNVVFDERGGAVDITANVGSLTVTSNRDVTLSNVQSTGLQVTTSNLSNILVGSASAPSVTLSSDGAILQSGSDPAADLTAPTMTLTAQANIGPFELDTTTLTATSVLGAINLTDTTGGVDATATAASTLTLHSQNGDLLARNVIAPSISLFTDTSGKVILRTVNATNDLTVSSASNVEAAIAANGTPRATANTMTLSAQGAIGGVGGSGRLEVDATTLAAFSTGNILLTDTSGGLDLPTAAASNGSIFVTANNGTLNAGMVDTQGTGKNINLRSIGSDVIVDNVNALGDLVTVQADGAILFGPTGGTPRIESGSAVLTAGTGINLLLDVGTLTASVTGTGDISVIDQGGGLSVTSATTANGSMTLATQLGDLSVTSATGSGTVVLQTLVGGDVRVGNATGQTVVVTSTSEILELGADATADVTATTVTLTSFEGTNLQLDAVTLQSATADSGNIVLTDVSGGLNVDALDASTGDVTLVTQTSGNLNVRDVHGNNVQLNSAGAIQELGSDPDADLKGTAIALVAAGAIGPGNALEWDAPGGLTAQVTGVGAVTLSSTCATPILYNAVTTFDGSITLTGAAPGGMNVALATAGGNGNLTLKTTQGNLRVGAATAVGNTVTVNSKGSIVEISHDAAADFVGSTMSLIGTGQVKAEIDAVTLTARATSAGDVDLRDLSGGVQASALSAHDGAISLVAENGTLEVTALTAPTSSTLKTVTSGDVLVGNVSVSGVGQKLTVVAAGSLEELGDDTGADLTASKLVLSAGTGIGSAAQLETDATDLGVTKVTNAGAINLQDAGGGLNVAGLETTGGRIRVVAKNGPLSVASADTHGSGPITLTTTGSGNVAVGIASAPGNTVTLNAAGALAQQGSDPAADVVAGALVLTAGGPVALETDVATLTANLSGAGSLTISDLSGGLDVLQANTTSGSVNLTSAGGTLVARGVSAFGDVNLTATGGSIRLDQVMATGAATVDASVAVVEQGSDAGSDLTAGANSVIRAGSTIGVANALEVFVTNASLSVLAGGQSGGVSVRIDGTVSPTNTLIVLTPPPPGSVLFNGVSVP